MPNNFTYNLDIPFSTHNPSADQPLMQTNTDSINSIIAVDHFSFGTNKDGSHKQVTLTNEAAPGLGDGNGVLYANNPFGQSWPFWENALGSWQMIGPFSSLITPVASSNGYTWIPGGIILQWGTAAPVLSGSNPVSFNISFPTNVFIVVVTEKKVSSPSSPENVYVQNKSLGGFNYFATDNFTSLDWFAIGN